MSQAVRSESKTQPAASGEWEQPAVLGHEAPRVRRIAAVLFFVYLALSLAWPLSMVLGVEYSPPAAALMALATAILFAGVWLYLRRHPLDRAHAHNVLLLFGLVMAANTTAYMILVPQPIHTTNFMLIAASGAFVFFSRPHMIALLVSIVLCWCLAAWLAGINPDWFHWGAMLCLSCFLAGSALEVRLRVNRRLVALGQVAEQQRGEAQHALQLAQTQLNQREQIEARLIARERDLAQAQRQESLGVLAGGIAHDFNNLLSVIVGQAELGLREPQINGESKARFEEILKVSLEGAELTQMMLAYVGHAPTTPETLRLDLVVEQAHSLLRSMLPKTTGIKIDAGSRDLYVNISQKQITQVLVNLAVNASEALPKSLGTVTIALSAMTWSGNEPLIGGEQPANGRGFACLAVSDSGAGMTADVKSRIFEPFYSTKDTGRGLGLAACLGIAQMHGGGFQVETAAGLGTTVKLLLPLAAGPR